MILFFRERKPKELSDVLPAILTNTNINNAADVKRTKSGVNVSMFDDLVTNCYNEDSSEWTV